MMVTPTEQQALIDRLVELLHDPDYDPFTMVTVSDLAERLDITYPTAKARLKDLEQQGKLKRITVRMPDGKKSVAYVEPKP